MKRIGKIRSKKILSLLLILVMAAAVLPSDLLTVTEEAFAVQNDDEVKVDGGVKLGGYGSTSFYYDCDTKTVCNTAPESGSYAHFIPDYSGSGSVNVLELCNYTGGAIEYDSSNTHDWQINLTGENTITVEADSYAQGILSCKDLYIFGDRAGAKLTVNAKTASTDQNKWAVGIFMMYESDLIIGGYADVTVNVEGETQVTGIGSVHTNYFGSSFGGGVTLQGNASLKIDCAVRFSQMFTSTACIFARSLKVNTKGDLTANIASTNSEDAMGCYSVSVTYATLDYVRKMTVKGTMAKAQKSDHGSINGYDSSSDGKIRFDEDVLAYNCTSDNVAMWRGNSGEKPVTLKVQGGNIKDMGTSTGRFFQDDKVQISCWTDYVPEFEGAQFRRWYRITDDGKRVPFYEGSDSTCYYYISDGEGGDSTLWADINVYKSAFSYIYSNYSRINFSPVGDSIRLYDNCLVKNGGNADNPDDVVITTGQLYFGSQFTKDQLPEGIYQVASKVNYGYGTLNPWFYSDPFAVFYSTFVTQPRHDGDTGVLTFRLNAYLRSGSGAPKPQVDIVTEDKSTVVVENVKSGDAVTTLTAGQNYRLHINVYGKDYYSDPFEAQTVAERVFASAPTVTPDEDHPFIYMNLSYALQDGVTPYRLRLVNVDTDEVVLTSGTFTTTTISMSRIQVPEGIYRLEVQLRYNGVWYAHPSEVRVIYSPWGNPPEVDSGSGAWTDTPHYDSLTGLLSYEPNENAQQNIGPWQNQMLERLADDGETWEQVGVATNMAAGFDMSGLPNGIYRLKAVYEDTIEPYEYYSQPFAAFTHLFKSITTGSYNNETDVWIKAQLWEDALNIIGDERSTTYFYLCKPDDPASGTVFLSTANDEGMVSQFTAASNIRSAFNLTEEATGVDCRIGFTYGDRKFYSDEFRLDFRTPASFDGRYDTESGGPYRLRSAVKGDHYYQELYFDGARDDLNVTWNEEKPDWLTIRISDEVTSNGVNILVLEGTPTERGSRVNLTITVSNVSGSDTSSFIFALNTDLTVSPASGSTFVDTLTVCASGIAESDATYYYTYSIGEENEPMQPYVYQYQGTIDPNWGEELAFTTDLEAGEVVKIKVIAYSPEAGYIGDTAYAEYTKVAAPDAPTASRDSGIFSSEFDLQLSSSTGGDTVILYTIDGSDPTDPASTRYSYGTCDRGICFEETDEEGEVVRCYHYQYVAGKYVYNDGNPFPVGRGAEIGDTVTIKAVTYMAGWNEDYTAYELSNPSEVATFTYTKADGFEVSGTATSAGSDTDDVTIQLIPKGYSEAAYETMVEGNAADYAIPDVADGVYTMKVMKNNHVTREYTVTVGSEDVTQDVKIHLKGDINGDGRVTTIDFVRVNSHARGVTLLSGYELKCADVVGADGKVTTADAIRINAHAKGTSLLW